MQRGATEAAEAARIFEGQLAGALVAEDGQLALSNLAASAAHGFMPKIQTQGQLGQARWRLVSAPSIPGTAKFCLSLSYDKTTARCITAVHPGACRHSTLQIGDSVPPGTIVSTYSSSGLSLHVESFSTLDGEQEHVEARYPGCRRAYVAMRR